MKHTPGRLRQWARSLGRDAVALYLAARDPRVHWAVRVLAGLIAAYALSPVDLIPDFIPVLGYLDDLVLLPALAALVIRLVPIPVMAELRREADRRLSCFRRNRASGMLLVALTWLLAAAAITGVALFV